MKQLKRIYNFNFVADSAISASASPAQSAAARAETQEPETMVCYNCDHPDEAARAGEAREGAGSRACASATSPWTAPTPPTAGPGAAAPSATGCRLVQSRAANVPLFFTITEKAPTRAFSWLKSAY